MWQHRLKLIDIGGYMYLLTYIYIYVTIDNIHYPYPSFFCIKLTDQNRICQQCCKQYHLSILISICLTPICLCKLSLVTEGNIWRSVDKQLHTYSVAETTTTWGEGRTSCDPGDLASMDGNTDRFLEINMKTLAGMTNGSIYWLGAHYREWINDGHNTEACKTFMLCPYLILTSGPDASSPWSEFLLS